MRQRFSQMMAGRNGNDQFNRFLLIANVVLLLISSIFKNSFGKYLYYFVLVLLGYMYFRMFSRNLTKRREENGKYMRLQYKFAAEFRKQRERWVQRRDYKFFTFGGEPRVLYIAQGRGRGEPTVADFFDMDFNHLPFTIDHDTAPVPPEKPEGFERMKQLAAKLSRGTPQLRVDFYEVDGRVYFGEMTFFHCSGMEAFHPEQWDRTFGDWVTLPEKNGEVTL